MSAWEVTTEDIETALKVNGMTPSVFATDEEWDSHLDACREAINTDTVEKQALYGDDMNEQTEYAQLEIEEQLRNAELC